MWGPVLVLGGVEAPPAHELLMTPLIALRVGQCAFLCTDSGDRGVVHLKTCKTPEWVKLGEEAPLRSGECREHLQDGVSAGSGKPWGHSGSLRSSSWSSGHAGAGRLRPLYLAQHLQFKTGLETLEEIQRRGRNRLMNGKSHLWRANQGA